MNPLAIVDAVRGLSRGAQAALIAAAALAAFLLWLTVHDARLVDAHDAKAGEAQAKAVTRADRAAVAADQEREKQRRADSAATQEAIDNAETDHPDAVRRPAGPAVRAAADSLRRRSAESRRAAD